MNCLAQDPGYTRLKDQLIASTGLAFYADRDNLLADLLGRRISDLGLRGCSSYAGFLADGEKGSAEMDVLISHLTIGETSFFRDDQVFAAIREVILPDILARKKILKQLRIWSAGCSSGAEPYSLAITLAHTFADRIAGWDIGIYATDLNRSCLAQAARGQFRAWALHTASERIKRACFSKEGLLWSIHPQYQEWVSFHYMNLATPEFSTPFPAGTYFDLILCRNVMIYFNAEVNRSLIGKFYESLDEGGWLVAGASEYSPKSFDAFHAVTAPGVRLYQKKTPPRSRVPPPETPQPHLAHPPATVQPSLQPPAGPRPVDLEGLRQLLDRGNWHDAAKYGQELLSRNKLNPEIHFYRALVFENAGAADEAERALRQAIYLDRSFALAHYHLGLALKRAGQLLAADRSFGNVGKALAGMPDASNVRSGPEVTAAELRRLAKMHARKPNGL